jgi:AcrR family transcriptional regulator
MQKHRGKILHDVLYRWCEKTGWTITALARKVGYNASSTYRHFEKDDLAYHIIAKYGKVINHDFRVEFPEMEDEYSFVDIAAEPDRAGYEPITLTQAIAQRETWKNKYMELLEKYNTLLVKKLEEVTQK